MILDLRDIVPGEHQSQVAYVFHQLTSGESILLVNDHDPKPLLSQFRSVLGDRFFWDYLQAGPKIWQVQIGLVVT